LGTWLAHFGVPWKAVIAKMVLHSVPAVEN
jgi:hypothetical protein